MRDVKRGERALLVGRTGTGKSTLARYMLSRTRQFIIIADAKGDFDFPDCEVLTDPEQLSGVRRSRKLRGIIYRPDPEFWTHDTWNSFFLWVYQFRDCVLYVDELFGVMPDGRKPMWLQACLTRGRSLGITCIAGTQRPFSIPVSILSESELRFMFALSLLDDKKRMAELMPGTTLVDGREQVTVLQPLKGPHNFYYYDVKSGEPTKEFCLRLSTKAVQQNANSR